MKLRNKKTGDIVDLAKRGLLKSDNDNHIILYTDGKLKYYTYKSLTELYEEWEDYEPTDPLIEDEKTRNVLREWAELIGAEHFKVNHFFNSKGCITLIRSTDLTTEPSIELPGHIGKDLETYNQIELCGEAE